MTHHDDRSADRLEELLQLSGPRPEPPADRFERARAAAHAAWQSRAAGQTAPDAPFER